MTSMIEKVARALTREIAIQNSLADVDSFVDEFWPDRRGGAKAAIKAMREPTEKMIKAGIDAQWEEKGAVYTHQAIIDAALEDTP